MSATREVTYEVKHRLPAAIFNSVMGNKLTAPIFNKPINPSDVIASAITAAKTDDFGGDDFLEPLDILCDSLNAEARLNPIGRFLASGFIKSDLVNRLKLVDALRLNPDIEKTPVVAPISIIGMPRTGTSFFFEMATADTRFRIPMSWEAANPFPHPEAGSFNSDKRIADYNKITDFIGYLADGFDVIHETGAQVPQECIVLQGPSIRSQSYATTYRIPSYSRWLAQSDMTLSYRWHKKMIQYLQYKHGADKRWILKSPNHVGSVKDFLKIYPDAVFVQTHRDLNEVLPSAASLYAKMRGAFTTHIDPRDVGAEIVDIYGAALNKLVQQRIADPALNARIIDIKYLDIVANPVAAFLRMCDFAGMELMDVEKLKNHAAASPQHKNGVHIYKADWFGIQPEDIKSKFSEYTEKYV